MLVSIQWRLLIIYCVVNVVVVVVVVDGSFIHLNLFVRPTSQLIIIIIIIIIIFVCLSVCAFAAAT